MFYHRLLSKLMLYTLPVLISLPVSLTANAKPVQADTSAYQTQRLKVNALLAERSARFGQYDQSLNQRTGIFGMQTRQDVKNSNEILRQIVLNDNNIFKELKILMNYKDQVVQQVQRDASNSNSRIQNYMTTIKKLQEQNNQLKKDVALHRDKKKLALYVIIFLSVSLVAATLIFMRKVRTIRS